MREKERLESGYVRNFIAVSRVILWWPSFLDSVICWRECQKNCGSQPGRQYGAREKPGLCSRFIFLFGHARFIVPWYCVQGATQPGRITFSFLSTAFHSREITLHRLLFKKMIYSSWKVLLFLFPYVTPNGLLKNHLRCETNWGKKLCRKYSIKFPSSETTKLLRLLRLSSLSKFQERATSRNCPTNAEFNDDWITWKFKQQSERVANAQSTIRALMSRSRTGYLPNC